MRANAGIISSRIRLYVCRRCHQWASHCPCCPRLYIGAYAALVLNGAAVGGETVRVDPALLASPAALERAAPSGEGSGLRITLISYEEQAQPPRRSLTNSLTAIRIRAEKGGVLPAFYSPELFRLTTCSGYKLDPYVFSSIAKVFWISGSDEQTIYFSEFGDPPCELEYAGGVMFEFR